MGRDEPEDFERYYRDHFERVARASYLVLGSREEALDVAQESFARTWRDWDRVGQRQQPLFFTLRVARNLSISLLRVRRTMSRTLELANHRAPASLDDIDVRVTVRAAVRGLPRRQRWALVLCDFLDLPAGEAAKILRIAPSTLRVHLARARTRIREALTAGEAASGAANRGKGR